MHGLDVGVFCCLTWCEDDLSLKVFGWCSVLFSKMSIYTFGRLWSGFEPISSLVLYLNTPMF